MARCRTTGCQNDVTRHKGAGLCNTCYAFVAYWSKKSVTQQMQRVDKLEFWSKRSKQLLGRSTVSAPVVTTPPKRRQRRKVKVST